MKTVFIIGTLIICALALNEELLDYVSDDVPGGSYKYYSLTYDGYIKIRLTSLTGDADLYASQTTTKPTYEPDHYCLQSTTCGEDIIFIPKSFKRPVSIGVYGHPSHEISKYTLSVFEITVEDDNFPYHTSRPEISDKDRDNKKPHISLFADLLWQGFMEFFANYMLQLMF